MKFNMPTSLGVINSILIIEGNFNTEIFYKHVLITPFNSSGYMINSKSEIVVILIANSKYRPLRPPLFKQI